jgi:hypothetical protein
MDMRPGTHRLGLFGTLKVRDDVRVIAEATLPAG